MGKTRDIFKKIRDIKGTFQARIGMIKDRNGKDLTEAKEIKKRWQEYTEELHKKVSMTQITEQTLGDSEGQGSLACCSPWGLKESDVTERLNSNNRRLTGAQSKKRLLPERMNSLGKGSEAWKGMARASAQLGT